MSFFPLLRARGFLLHCQVCFYLVLALLSGALLPIQVSLNAKLARSLDSVPVAADVFYLIGLLALLLLLFLQQGQHVNWSALSQLPPWTFVGGLFGAWYVVSSAYFTSNLGATLTLGFVVGGQAIAGLITDQFGWLGMPQRRLTPHRQVAVGLLAVALFFLAQ
ncbi:MAG TPA: DMT family transporter [Chroococcidiopsis sp.]